MTALRNYLADTRKYLVNAGVVAAVANHDTPAQYRWLMEIISHQGIADRIARDCLDRHGRVQWADLEDGLRRPDPCPKLATYWTFHGCGYRKSACTCAVPPQLPHCIIPEPPTRNGRLAQSAAALYLFLRDVCGGDFISWIDDHLSRSNDPNAAPIIDALRHIHGVSDKVVSLALVVLLLGGRPGDPLWQAAGAQLIVIDTLVHNWLHQDRHPARSRRLTPQVLCAQWLRGHSAASRFADRRSSVWSPQPSGFPSPDLICDLALLCSRRLRHLQWQSH